MQPPRTRRPVSIARLLSERARAGQAPAEPIETSIPGLSGLFATLRDLATGLSELSGQSGEGEQDTTIGGGPARIVFGYTMRMGLDGAQAEPFGHVPELGAKPDAAAPRQPIVDVYAEGAEIVVIAELPGVEATEIDCRVDDHAGTQTLHVSTGGPSRWDKTIPLPSPCDPASLVRSCRNGILEIRLTRREGSTP